MIKSLSNAQMREADQYTIKTLGVPFLTLMERAGYAIAAEVEKALNYLQLNEALIVCGGGNNGGDGFVVARLLKDKGVEISILCLAEKFSPDCLAMKEKYTGEILKVIPRRRYPFIVDCMFGTGLSRAVEGEELALIDFINSCGAFVLSVDIPSGLNGDNGVVMGKCVQATQTVTIGEYKNGLILNDGGDISGAVKRVDIGIDMTKIKDCALIAEDRDIARLFPERKRNTHKGNYGKVSIIAGSKAYVGAALLATMSALKTGAGYTELCVPAGLFNVYAGKIPEAILTCFQGEESFVFCKKDLENLLKNQCIAFGMGVGVSHENYKIIKYLLENYTGKLLLDADALNSLSKYGVEILKTKKCSVLLTPHIKEFSRLTNIPVSKIEENGVEIINRFTKEYQVAVLLKSATSILCGEGKTYFNTRGSACLAKGGSGDVLSGVIGGVSAQGHSLLNAAIAGAYIAGVAAELCEKELGQYSVTATDVINRIAFAILSVTENAND